MIPIFKALEELDAKRKATVHFPLFEENNCPACHLVMGTFRAGKWIAMVPGEAEIGCRIGFIPGEKTDEIRSLIEDTVKSAAAGDPWLAEHPPTIEWLPFYAHPHYQDPKNPFVQMVMAAAQQAAGSGAVVKERGMTGADDGRFAKHFGFPSVSFGPSGDRIHGVDEYVELDSVAATAKAVALATFNWCAQEKNRSRNSNRQ
jgi:acetylornithine deacetylase